MLLADNISLSYGDRVICGGISFKVESGECVLLCGPNGSGKTTLLRALAGRGAVMVPARIPKVGGFTLKEFIRASLWKENKAWGAPSRELDGRIEEAMQTLEISRLAGRDLSTLSDGEFQKACIAPSLVRREEAILLDEPTAFLDVDGRLMVLEAIRRISRSHAVVFSSHDIADAGKYCTRIFGLTGDGRFLDSAGGDENIFKACFEHYGE